MRNNVVYRIIFVLELSERMAAYMEKEIIKLKGTGDGVKIYLDSGSSISEITSSLYEKLRQFRKFFGDGHCNIYFLGRELTPSDKMRLEAIAGAMLPASTVNYGERRRSSEKENMEKTIVLPEEVREEAAVENGENNVRKIKDVVTTNFKSSRARFYEGIVRGGKKVESDGHLILVGDVLEDGAVSAVGNIVIMGALRGKAHAGCMGSDGAYIIALNMSPADIRISNAHAYYDSEYFRGGAKKAYLLGDKIIAEDFKL